MLGAVHVPRTWCRRRSYGRGGADLRGWQSARLVVQDRQQRLPRPHQGQGSSHPSLTSFRDVPWLEPYPDRLLDQLDATGQDPQVSAIGRETIELTFLSRDPAAAATATSRGDPSRRPGLAGPRHRRTARPQYGGGEQRPAARSDDAAQPAADIATRGMGIGGIERGRT